MNKNFVLSALGIVLSVVALAGVFLLFTRPVEIPPLGAVVGGELAPTGYYSLNGINYFATKLAIQATSTVPCAVKGPFATSTLVSFSIDPSTSTFLAAETFDLSTSTVPGGNGSTTPAFMYAASIPTVPIGPVVWQAPASTTALAIGPSITANGWGVGNYIKSSETLSVRIATGSPGVTGKFTGVCNFTFRQF